MQIPLIEVKPNNFYTTDTGVADAYVATVAPLVTALTSDLSIYVKILNSNATATPTLNFCNLGVKTIQKENNISLLVNDIISGGTYNFKYDLVNGVWLLLNPSSVTSNDIITKNPWVDIRVYGTVFTDATLNSAIASIGSTPTFLLITPGTWNINNNVTFPLNICVKILKGATLKVATGKTLTFNGAIEAGDYQIFDASASPTPTIQVYGNGTVYLSWFGPYTTTGTDLVNASINSKVLQMIINNHSQPVTGTRKIYVTNQWILNDTVYIATGTWLEGTGKNGNGNFFKAYPSNSDMFSAPNATTIFRVKVKDLAFWGNSTWVYSTNGNTTGSGFGQAQNGTYSDCTFENLWFYSFAEYGLNISIDSSTLIDVDAFYNLKSGLRLFSSDNFTLVNGHCENNKYWNLMLNQCNCFTLSGYGFEDNSGVFGSYINVDCDVSNCHNFIIENCRLFNYAPVGINVYNMSYNGKILNCYGWHTTGTVCLVDNGSCWNIDVKNTWNYNGSENGSAFSNTENRTRTNAGWFMERPAIYTPKTQLKWPGWTSYNSASVSSTPHIGTGSWGVGADRQVGMNANTISGGSTAYGQFTFNPAPVTGLDVIVAATSLAQWHGAYGYFTISGTNQNVIPSAHYSTPMYTEENGSMGYYRLGNKWYGTHYPAGATSLSFAVIPNIPSVSSGAVFTEFILTQSIYYNGFLTNGFTAGVANGWTFTGTGTPTADVSMAQPQWGNSAVYPPSGPPSAVVYTQMALAQKITNGAVNDTLLLLKSDTNTPPGALCRYHIRLYVTAGNVAVNIQNGAYPGFGPYGQTTETASNTANNQTLTTLPPNGVVEIDAIAQAGDLRFICLTAGTTFAVLDVGAYAIEQIPEVANLKTTNVFSMSSVTNSSVASNTLSLGSGNVFDISASTAQTINTISPVIPSSGQPIYLLFKDANTTMGFANAGNIKGNNGINWISSAGAMLAGIYDGTNWWLTESYVPGTRLNIQYLTAGTTYTPTPGTRAIEVEAAGGGGGGGGASSTNVTPGGGGGAGWVRKRWTGVTGTLTYAIGAAGAGGATGANGSAGGNTTFTGPDATVITASGGGGGVSGAPGGGGGGGGGTNGDIIIPGRDGESGITTIKSGGGGDSVLGHGASGNVVAGGARNGTGYGSGGNAAFNSTSSGGNGSSGIIIVYEYT